jgi:putative ABC transport system permease protein
LKLILIGLGLGLIAAYNLTQVLTSYIYGVNHADPPTYMIVSLLLIGIAVLTCYVPVRRATQVDPMVALRYE